MRLSPVESERRQRTYLASKLKSGLCELCLRKRVTSRHCRVHERRYEKQAVSVEPMCRRCNGLMVAGHDNGENWCAKVRRCMNCGHRELTAVEMSA